MEARPIMGPCPHPHCDSSDAHATYPDDGHSFCFSCETYTHGERNMQTSQVLPMTNRATSPLKTTGISDAIAERKISKTTTI